MNTASHATRWTHFIAAMPEFPAGAALLAQYNAGDIKSLCTCGCNSYTFRPSSSAEVPLLASAGGTVGSVFEALFKAGVAGGTVEFVLYADAEGRLAGLDVHYCANSYPMREPLTLAEPPVHTRQSDSLVA